MGFKIFCRKKTVIKEGINLKSSNLERVKKFCFLGVHFDSRLTWGEHIRNVEDKCKKVINIMFYCAFKPPPAGGSK